MSCLVDESSFRGKEAVGMRVGPDASWECLCLEWEGLGKTFPAHLRVLEVYRSWRDDRLQLKTLSA